MSSAKKRFSPKRQIGVGGLRIGRAERRYVAEVLRSHRLSYGPMTRRFEDEWAKVHGCAFAVFCNSGTSALHISLAALKEEYGWRDGDEVLVPAVQQAPQTVAEAVLEDGHQAACCLVFDSDELVADREARNEWLLAHDVLAGLPGGENPCLSPFFIEHGRACRGKKAQGGSQPVANTYRCPIALRILPLSPRSITSPNPSKTKLR